MQQPSRRSSVWSSGAAQEVTEHSCSEGNCEMSPLQAQPQRLGSEEDGEVGVEQEGGEAHEKHPRTSLNVRM